MSSLAWVRLGALCSAWLARGTLWRALTLPWVLLRLASQAAGVIRLIDHTVYLRWRSARIVPAGCATVTVQAAGGESDRTWAFYRDGAWYTHDYHGDGSFSSRRIHVTRWRYTEDASAPWHEGNS